MKLDTEQEAAIASRYAIRSIPTLMIFRGGQILAQRSGSLPKSLFKEWLLSTAAAPK
ncbi:Thioredoxin-2 [compost metagenome]